MTTTYLRPGIYFKTVVPAVPEVLPRMDIAAFVGFAPSGPIHVPVAIEDVSRFRDVFGDDQVLGWDADNGVLAKGQLGSAISAFFRNGGHRCWVIRIARKHLSPPDIDKPDQAQSNEFNLPGLLQLGPAGKYEAGWMEARSEGSWTDDYAVNATLSYAALEVAALAPTSDGFQLQLDPASPQSAQHGDLLQVVFQRSGGVGGATRQTIAFLPVISLDQQELGSPPLPTTVLSSGRGDCFDVASPEDFSAFLASPPAATSGSPIAFPAARSVTLLTRFENRAMTPLVWGEKGSQFFALVSRAQAGGVQGGSWLRLEFDPGTNLAAGTVLYALVSEIQGTAIDPTLLSITSPPGSQELVEILISAAWWQLDANTALTRSVLPVVSVDAVTLELWVRDSQARVTRLANLGLAPAHPRYLGLLPTDSEVFNLDSNTAQKSVGSLFDEVMQPRFAMAAPPLTDNEAPLVFLPLGVPGVPLDDFYQPAIEPDADAMVRDGLNLFDPDLFLDPDLKYSTSDTLLTDAFHKQYQLQRDPTAPTAGEPLEGIHAILPIDEVSLLCVPDASSRGWQSSSISQDILGAPDPLSVSIASIGDTVATWPPVTTALSYVLEQSADPRFNTSQVAWQGAATVSDPIVSPQGCSKQFFYRVRASGPHGPGPWSGTVLYSFDTAPFVVCQPDFLDAPELTIVSDDPAQTVFEWMGAADADSFLLQSSIDPTFSLASTLYQGPLRSFTVLRAEGVVAYFRVAAQSATLESPWSKTLFTLPSQQNATWSLLPSPASPLDDVVSTRGNNLLEIHRAILRLCAARADLSALLSVPPEYDVDPCVLYCNRLEGLISSEGGDRELSYGSLFHPWLLVSDTPGDLRPVAPDGTIAGVLAARTISGGAWYSPANQVLNGVLGLQPDLPASSQPIFFAKQINQIEQEPRGFLAEGSATLSGDIELNDLGVRRLMILLRRLALRDGVKFVFEANDRHLQRRVRREFAALLRTLYLRGAFAGASPDEAYMVVTDSRVNTQDDQDAGRFIVELRVAPSLPLQFLTVRLVQNGGELSVNEVAV
jgi:hypothetical protein